MIESVIIYAPNVGGGGGLVLLQELLQSHWPFARITAILDRRGKDNIRDLRAHINIQWVNSSLRGRWYAERLLAKVAEPQSLILCFHNLPPILPVHGFVFCYVQNANLVGIIPASHLSGWVRIRCVVERFIARRFRHRINRYVVQTPTMALALRSWYGEDVPPIDVLPFAAFRAPSDLVDPEAALDAPRWDFIYPSDGSVHKNHRRLFAAWRLLAEQGVRPSLVVTLHPQRDRDLRKEVDVMAAEGILVEDVGFLPHLEVLSAYRKARALIFPSYAESFGIPLIEASEAGLPILAPELDYVRDVCDPVATFDANSPHSIARAVRRFLGLKPDQIDIIPADRFVVALSDRALSMS